MLLPCGRGQRKPGGNILRRPPFHKKEDRVIRRTLLLSLLVAGLALGRQKVAHEKEASLKADAATQIDGMKKQAQVMVDTIFSFGELGFQEIETSKYLTAILEKEGFRVERGLAGIPTAFLATWGQGKPVIALGSDIDDIPQASQKPGVAYHDPIKIGRASCREVGSLRST